MLIAVRRGGVALWPILCLLLSIALPTALAQAKVVGILFDDSGSMNGKIHLPAFGAQMLVSTLDGTTEDGDRLFTARLSQFNNAFPNKVKSGDLYNPELPIEYGAINPDTLHKLLQYAGLPLLREEDVQTRAGQRKTIDRIRWDWTENPRVHTPYEPLEILLNHLVSKAKPDEPGFLIVISDGVFYGGRDGMVPDRDQLRRSFETYSRRAPGGLTAIFLLIAPDATDPNAVNSYHHDDLVQVVNYQGVRSNLLGVFNGNDESFSYDVKDFSSLLAALKEIVAAVSSTNLDREGQIVTTEGKEITVRAPFSIKRIISLATAEESERLPKLAEADLPGAQEEKFDIEMAKGDNHDGRYQNWPTTRVLGQTTQIRFPQALKPGQYKLSFDSAVGEKVALLFDTDVVLSVAILDEEGKPVPVENGEALLIKGKPYRVEARVLDRAAGPDTDADLSAIQGLAEFTASFSGTAWPPLLLEIDPDSNRAVADFAPSSVPTGRAALRTTLKLPGFVTAESRPIRLRVEDRSIAIAVNHTSLLPCQAPACDRGEGEVPDQLSLEPATLADVEVTISEQPSGGVRIALEGPVGPYRLERQNGEVVNPERPLSFERNVPLRLRLVRGGIPELDQGMVSFDRRPLLIKVRGDGKLIGEAEHGLVVLPGLGQADLRYLGYHLADPQGLQSGQATVNGSQLINGEAALVFELVGSPVRPPETAFEVLGGSSLHSFDLRAGGPIAGALRYQVLPRTTWPCDCLIYLANWFSGEAKEMPVSLRFNGIQGRQFAVAEARPRAKVTPIEALYSCGRLLGLLALAIYLAGVLFAVLRSDVFPAGSHLEVEDGSYKRFVPLAQSGVVMAKLRMLFSAIWKPYGRPRQSVFREGLNIEAESGGMNLKPRRGSWPNYYLERIGEKLEDIRAGANQAAVSLIWGDELREGIARGRVIRVKRKYE